MVLEDVGDCFDSKWGVRCGWEEEIPNEIQKLVDTEEYAENIVHEVNSLVLWMTS